RRIVFRVGTLLFYLFVLALLVLVLFIGVKVNGATSWLDLPGTGARLQPSEFGKLAAVLLLSAMFASPVFSVNRWWCFLLGAAVVIAPAVLILLEPDFGSAMVFIPIFAGIVFVAGLRLRFVVAAILLAVLLGGGLAVNEVFRIHPLLKDYQRDRILVFMDPETDLLASGYNQYQARLAVGAGGFMGKGVGEGTQNTLGFLPQSVSNNDFIFSVIAEETGFIGCVALISAYLLLFFSVFRTAFVTGDPFGRYIAIGVGCVMFTHCFVNIGMSVGLTPVTGVPLPFISYGGSFMLMGMASFGIMQSIYRHRATE
ncbi:MAG: FtsW/RodA/SpoVE family cell cycle protein, partial [Victivallaceae bacterium]|nr:FtsW/RodA/SpoVE family cell cycle protein [Victivallaceae bacterium]